MKQEKTARLNVELDEKMLFKLKEIAAKRHIKLREYVLGILELAIEDHDR